VNGNITLINQAFEVLTGFTKEEVIGKNWFEVIVPRERFPSVWNLFDEFRSTGKIPEAFENPILTKDGKEKYISWKNNVLKKDDNILGTISFGIDITESLFLLNQFVETQKSYQTLVQFLPGVIYKCKYDRNLTIEYISEKCLELTGYDPLDLINNRKLSYADLIFPADLDMIFQKIDESIEKNDFFQLTYRIITKDNKLKWVWEQGIAIKDSRGKVEYLEGYIFDISERIRTEHELTVHREYFNQLFENAPLAIVILDKNDLIIDVNKSFEDLFLFDREEVKGLSLNQLIVPPHLKEEGTRLSNKVLENEIVMTETKRMRKNGTLIDVLVIGYPIILKGERIGIFGLYKNITEEKRVYELLKQEKEKVEELSNLKSNFLLNISHEIRTPLNTILGFSELLLSELEVYNNKELLDFVHSIKRGGLRLLNLMDNIIEISLIESSRSELQLEKVNILFLVEPILRSFDNIAREKNIFVKTDFQTDFYITTDTRRLELVLRNIIDNAFKFTEKGGVTVTTKIYITDGKKMGVVEILDTGIGISEKFMSKLFQPFAQESTGLSREYEGIGLGLSLSKKLIELLNGRIEIESKLEKGTLVRILIPLED